MLYILDVKPLGYNPRDRGLDYEDVMFAVIDVTPELIREWLDEIRKMEVLVQQNPKAKYVTITDDARRLFLYRPDEKLEELFYQGSEYVSTHSVTEEEKPIIEDKLPYDAELCLSVYTCDMIVTEGTVRWEINGKADTMPFLLDELEEMLKKMQ